MTIIDGCQSDLFLWRGVIAGFVIGGIFVFNLMGVILIWGNKKCWKRKIIH